MPVDDPARGSVDALHLRAENCRLIASRAINREVADELRQLARELDAQAARLAGGPAVLPSSRR